MARPRIRYGIRIPARDWRYICSRLQMHARDVRRASGLTHCKNLEAHIESLDELCKVKTGCSLEELIDEAKDVFSVREIAYWLGPDKARAYYLVRSRGIKPVTTFPVLFIEQWDFAVLLGAPYVAQDIKRGPLYRWRTAHKLPSQLAAEKLGISRRDFISLEGGNRSRLTEPLKKKIQRACGKKTLQDLLVWFNLAPRSDPD